MNNTAQRQRRKHALLRLLCPLLLLVALTALLPGAHAANQPIVTTAKVNLRAGPSTSTGRVVYTVAKGTELSCVEKMANGWSKIVYKNATLYVYSQYTANKPAATPATPAPSGSATIVTTAKVNLRQGPSTSTGRVAYTVAKGTTLTRLEKMANGWSKVLYNNATLFVFSQYTAEKSAPATQPTTPATPAATTAIVTTSAANLRKGPSTSTGKIAYTVAKGTELARLEKMANGWSKIAYKGQTLYVHSSIVMDKPVVPTVSAAEVAKLAAAQNTTKLLITCRYNDYFAKVFAFEKKNGTWTPVLTCDGTVGKNGVSYNRVQNDRTTPGGVFTFGTAFGIANKPAAINLPYFKVTKNDYLINDSDSKYYNQFVDITKVTKDWKNGAYEHLISYDKSYQYAAFINFNWPNPVKKKGAGIFLHCYGNSSYTEGCVAVAQDNMIKLLGFIDANTKIVIVANKADLAKY